MSTLIIRKLHRTGTVIGFIFLVIIIGFVFLNYQGKIEAFKLGLLVLSGFFGWLATRKRGNKNEKT